MGTLTIAEQASDPDEPVAGDQVIFPKTDGEMYTHVNGGSVRRVLLAPTDYVAGQVPVFTDDGLVWTDYTRPNLLINGDFRLDQIREGTTYTFSAGGGQGHLDGWVVSVSGAGGIQFQAVQDPDYPRHNALRMKCSTADASVAAGDYCVLYQIIEGYKLTDLGVGTSSAGWITIQFDVKGLPAGDYGLGLVNGNADRSYCTVVTIPDTGRHTITKTVRLDQTGTWNYTNGRGMYVLLVLMGGTSQQTSTYDEWKADASYFPSTQANFLSSTSNEAYIGRIQLIPSRVPLPFNVVDYGAELARAQRYFEKTYDPGVAIQTGSANGGALYRYADVANTGQHTIPWYFKVTKRTTPTMQSYSWATGTAGYFWCDGTADRAVAFNNTGLNASFVYHASGASITYRYGHCTADARLL